MPSARTAGRVRLRRGLDEREGGRVACSDVYRSGGKHTRERSSTYIVRVGGEGKKRRESIGLKGKQDRHGATVKLEQDAALFPS